MIGTVGPTAFLTTLNKPREGVRPPPLARFEQSSSLSAPPRTALFNHDRIMNRRKTVRPGMSAEGRADERDCRFDRIHADLHDQHHHFDRLYAKIGAIASGDFILRALLTRPSRLAPPVEKSKGHHPQEGNVSHACRSRRPAEAGLPANGLR